MALADPVDPIGAARTTIIRNVRVVDATGGPPIPRGWIAIVDGQISEVGRGTPRDLGSEVVGIDGTGLTALPGLIDCHAHAVGFHRRARDRAPDPFTAAADTLDVLSGLQRVVRSGVTTIRDCGYPHHGIFAVRDAAQAGMIESPRLVLSGRAIAATAGHGASISVEVSGADEARRAVRVEAKAGADWIKLMMTGGTATPGESVTDVQLTLDEARAAVDEAHRRGRRVSAHCSNLKGTMLALDAGVDSIEHGIAIDAAAARRMADGGVWLAPSLLCTQIEGTAGPESGIPDYVRRKGAEIYRQQQASFQVALAAGVRMAAATDAEVAYLPLGSGALARELALMVELGMTPQAAVASATRCGAELLGLEASTGTLEAGRMADIVLVGGDPLTDISAVGETHLVMRAGRVVWDVGRRSPGGATSGGHEGGNR
jgi:imidazolonepropionase-like amidohydrolase